MKIVIPVCSRHWSRARRITITLSEPLTIQRT